MTFQVGSDGQASGRNWRLVLFELFFALSLSVAYYFLVKNYSAGVQSNSTNYWVFSSCSVPTFHLEQLYDVWKGRLSGLLLSGAVFDGLVTGNSVDPEQYAIAFGVYQAVWLGLLFLLVIYAVNNSVLVNLGIFAGLMYNFSPAAGLYFYPWDIPAAFFFTLAVMLYQREQILWAAAVVCAGSFFKETVLIGALLLLFARQWRWLSRAALFLAVVAIYIWGKKLLMEKLRVAGAVLSMGDATNVRELFRGNIMAANVHTLFSPSVNQVLFANGGTIAAILLLGWRRRYRVYTLIILAFIVGNFFYGAFSEFRIFIQILPLTWILLAECWKDLRTPVARSVASAPGLKGDVSDISADAAGRAAEPAWAMGGTTWGLARVAAIALIVSTVVIGWRFGVVAGSRQPAEQARVMEELRTKAGAGDARAAASLGLHYLRGEGIEANLEQAVMWLRRAAESGNPEAQCQLGLLYAQGQGVSTNYQESLGWFRKAGVQGHSEAQYALGCCFEKGLGTKPDIVEAALWYQRAAEKGNARAQLNLGMLLCVGRNEPEEGAAWFRKAAELGSADAQNALGTLCRQGRGTQRDDVEAYKWLKLAQLQGNKSAEDELKLCAESMSKEQVVRAEQNVKEFLQKRR